MLATWTLYALKLAELSLRQQECMSVCDWSVAAVHIALTSKLSRRMLHIQGLLSKLRRSQKAKNQIYNWVSLTKYKTGCPCHHYYEIKKDARCDNPYQRTITMINTSP
jgi:hypothetical protein